MVAPISLGHRDSAFPVSYDPTKRGRLQHSAQDPFTIQVTPPDTVLQMCGMVCCTSAYGVPTCYHRASVPCMEPNEGQPFQHRHCWMSSQNVDT